MKFYSGIKCCEEDYELTVSIPDESVMEKAE